MANGLLSMEGSTIPESVRKAALKALQNAKSMGTTGVMRPSITKAAKGVLAKQSAKAADAAFKYGPTPVVKGLLSKEAAEYLAEKAPKVAPQVAKAGASSALSGLAAVYEGGSDLYNSGLNPMKFGDRLAKGKSELEAAQFVKDNPDAAAKGSQFAEGIVGRAVGAAKDAYGKAPDQYAQGLAQGKYPANLMDPNAKPPVAPQVAQEVESKRQVAEAGAKKQLAQGQLSRPKAAAAIVQADAQRSGEQLTPEQTKAKIAEETAVMKTMNDDELSKYLSYALIAGGLLASHLDKSGNAGQAFAGGFNAQLDRGQKEKLFKYQQDQAAASAAAKAALKERELTNAEANTESMIQSRADSTNLSREELAAKRENWNRTAGLAEAKLAAYRDRTQATADGKSGKTPTAPALSQKDNMELVDNYTAGKGLDLDKGVLEAAASRLPNIQKNYPDLSIQEQMDLVFSEFEATPGKVNTFFPNTDPGYKLK
jgi:hypothetical protein